MREWFWTFLAVLIVLLIIMIGVTMGELLNDVAGGRLPAGLIGLLLFLRLPEVLSNIVPLAVLVAVTWGLGRLYRDQEMAVMRASGFGWSMLLRPLFNLLLPVSALMLISALFLAPSAAEYAQHRMEQAIKSAAEWGLQTGQFHVLQNGETILYVESVETDGKSLNNIFMHRRHAEREQVWIARKGYYSLDEDLGERYLTLQDGQITAGVPGQLDFGVIRFARNDLRLPRLDQPTREKRIEARPSRELLFADSAEESAEIQFRISPAIAVVILGLLAIPLAHSAPREGRSGRIVLGVLAYAVYANVLYLCRGWVASGALPASLGLWWVHVVIFCVAFFWLHRQGRVVGRG